MPSGDQGKVSSGFSRDHKCRKLICENVDKYPFSSLTMNEAIRSYSLFAVVAIGAAVALGAWIRSRRKTPDQIEQERRLRISEIGRITDGTVIDVNELTSEPDAREMQLLVYQYDVAGVSYEASQDVTSLRHRVDLHSCRAGLMTSIKYDPANPGNSIVIAENWNGLRQ